MRHDRIEGWAFDLTAPDTAISVVIVDNGAEIARIVADGYRPDLQEAGFGNGCHSFSYAVPGGLAADVEHEIAVCIAGDWMALPGSPVSLAPRAAAGVVTVETAAKSIGLGPLRGSLDTVNRTRISGWAQDEHDCERPVGVAVSVNGRIVERVLANRYRADLDGAGLGSGRHGFDVTLAAPLTTHEAQDIRVFRAADGAELPGSPVTLPAASRFDAEVEASLAAAFAQFGEAADEDRALAFLTAEAERLRARRAERDSGRTQRDALRRHTRRGGSVAEEGRKRALVIDDMVPCASRDAGSVAILSHMRALRALGYEVGFAARIAGADAGAALAGEGVALYGAPYYAGVEDVLARQAGTFDLVYLHRLANADRYLSLARGYNPNAQIVYG